MNCDSLNVWCKWLEKNFSPDIMIPTVPVIIRLDGVGFSTWTKGLNKPFDERLTDLMIETAKFLTKETNVVISYTQSDEITLILYSSNRRAKIYHDGKKQKIISKLTAKCTNFFNEERKKFLPEHDKVGIFDCRIYQTPTLSDAAAQLLWRENDAIKNSISMLAREHFSHKRLEHLSGNQRQDLLMTEKGINWNDLHRKFKRGSYVKRNKTFTPFLKEELEKLPLKHNAHKDPTMLIERNVIDVIDLPIFNKIINKDGVVFFNEEPKITE